MNEPTLFDSAVRRMNPNSSDAFFDEDVQVKRLTQKEKIWLACKKKKLANDRMMSELSGVPRYLVPDRRAGLVKENRLRFVNTLVDPKTNKKSDFYEVVE